MKKLLFVIIYLVLTAVKLFTAQVGFDAEVGPMIVVKAMPTIGNIYYIDFDTSEHKFHTFKWNFHKIYVAKEHLSLIILYDFFILVWWCLTAVIIFSIFRKIVRGILKTY